LLGTNKYYTIIYLTCLCMYTTSVAKFFNPLYSFSDNGVKWLFFCIFMEKFLGRVCWTFQSVAHYMFTFPSKWQISALSHFSVGFWSGFAGQVKTDELFLSGNLSVLLNMCFSTSSCWKAQTFTSVFRHITLSKAFMICCFHHSYDTFGDSGTRSSEADPQHDRSFTKLYCKRGDLIIYFLIFSLINILIHCTL